MPKWAQSLISNTLTMPETIKCIPRGGSLSRIIVSPKSKNRSWATLWKAWMKGRVNGQTAQLGRGLPVSCSFLIQCHYPTLKKLICEVSLDSHGRLCKSSSAVGADMVGGNLVSFFILISIICRETFSRWSDTIWTPEEQMKPVITGENVLANLSVWGSISLRRTGMCHPSPPSEALLPQCHPAGPLTSANEWRPSRCSAQPGWPAGSWLRWQSLDGLAVGSLGE